MICFIYYEKLKTPKRFAQQIMLATSV